MDKISNNDAWSNIFEDLRVLDRITTSKYFDISADEIKRRDDKEARLMTKVDHREHLPKVMAENSLSILAIKNGLYRIAKTVSEGRVYKSCTIPGLSFKCISNEYLLKAA